MSDDGGMLYLLQLGVVSTIQYNRHMPISLMFFSPQFEGLEYNYCVRKMRLLTLTSLAVESTEVAFSTLSSELDLPIEEVEMLILDGERKEREGERGEGVQSGGRERGRKEEKGRREREEGRGGREVKGGGGREREGGRKGREGEGGREEGREGGRKGRGGGGGTERGGRNREGKGCLMCD